MERLENNKHIYLRVPTFYRNGDNKQWIEKKQATIYAITRRNI